MKTTFTIIVEKESKQIGKRRLVVENNHQIGIDTQHYILLLLIHIPHCLEECGNLLYQCISLYVSKHANLTYNLETFDLK